MFNLCFTYFSLLIFVKLYTIMIIIKTMAALRLVRAGVLCQMPALTTYKWL